MADGILAIFSHAVSPCAITVQAAVRSVLAMLAPFNIVYNTVIDIMIRIENFCGLVMLRTAPGRRGSRPNRGNDGRKIIQTGDSPNA
jgi:hypothetical protein